MAHHWSEGVGVLRLTPREYEQELVEAGGQGNMLACPPTPQSAGFVALKVLQELAWQVRSPNTRKTVIIVQSRRLDSVVLEISLLTDLNAAIIGEASIEDRARCWTGAIEVNQVLVLTSNVLDDLLTDAFISMDKINLLVIEDCHAVVSDEHLQSIIANYKEFSETDKENIPRIIAFTYPLFNNEFLFEEDTKTSWEKLSNSMDSISDCDLSETIDEIIETDLNDGESLKMTDFNYWRVDFIEVEPLNSFKPDEVAVDNEIGTKALKIDDLSGALKNDDNNGIGRKIDKINDNGLKTDEISGNPHKIDEFGLKTDDINEVGFKIDDDIISGVGLKIDDSGEIGLKIDRFCSEQLGLDDVDILSNVAVISQSERCFVSDSEHEPELKRSIYDKLECQLEKLEELIMCKADMAGDIAGLKKITGKPREVILECPPAVASTEEGRKLEEFMKKVVAGAMVFLKDHRYDPTEIYGDEAFGEELRAIPDPCVEPESMLQQFLYILENAGPYGADKAAFSILVKIEKLKVKIPYERHFLLLCLLTSVFLQVRAAADLVFDKYPNEFERIQKFTRPRFLKMMEIFKIFKPPDSRNKSVMNSPRSTALNNARRTGNQVLKPNTDESTVKSENNVKICDTFVIASQKDNDVNGDLCEKDSEFENVTDSVKVDSDSKFKNVIDSVKVDSDSKFKNVIDSVKIDFDSEFKNVMDSVKVDSDSKFKNVIDLACEHSDYELKKESFTAGLSGVLQELEKCDFKKLGLKIEENFEKLSGNHFGVKRHSCDTDETEARKKMKTIDDESIDRSRDRVSMSPESVELQDDLNTTGGTVVLNLDDLKVYLNDSECSLNLSQDSTKESQFEDCVSIKLSDLMGDSTKESSTESDSSQELHIELDSSKESHFETNTLELDSTKESIIKHDSTKKSPVKHDSTTVESPIKHDSTKESPIKHDSTRESHIELDSTKESYIERDSTKESDIDCDSTKESDLERRDSTVENSSSTDEKVIAEVKQILDGVIESRGAKAISSLQQNDARLFNEAEFEDQQMCNNDLHNTAGTANNTRFSPRKKAWEGKRWKGKGPRSSYVRNYTWNDPDALCGIIFVDEPLMAKILCALIHEYCRSCPDLQYVCPQYTVDKMVDPLTDPREAETEHKRQEEVLKRFRTHECNLLIGTSVLEDGMDLPKCNLVIRWDAPKGYRSYAACRSRARAPKSLYALMAPHSPSRLVTALANYAQIEKMLVRKCSWREPGPAEEAHASKFSPLVEPYRPGAQAVSLAQAVQLLNRYCAKLPSDSFTRLVPLWDTEAVMYRRTLLYVCSIRLPINCPLKCQIVGHPMPTRVLARRIAALQVCRALHLTGELDDNLMPIGKENFKALDPDWLSLPPSSDLTGTLDSPNEPRPGTTKRKQYYYKKVAHSLSDCRPRLGVPCLAYEVRAVLAVPLPERHNTRGRKLHPPQAYKEGFAILTSRPIHQIPTFPMFTRSGEVRVNLERMALRVLLNRRRERLVHRFMRYTFSEVLRVHNHLMVFDSAGKQKRNSYYVVPTTKVTNTDGSSTVVIDWKFLELIYSQTESVAKETITQALREPGFGNILDCENANEDTIEITIETIEIEAKSDPSKELCIENISASEITSKSVVVEDTIKDNEVIDTSIKADDESKQVDKDHETIGTCIKTDVETEDKTVKNPVKDDEIDKTVKNAAEDDKTVKNTLKDDKNIKDTLKDDKSIKDDKKSDKDNNTVINLVKDDNTVKNTVKDDKTVKTIPKTEETEHQKSSEIVEKAVEEKDVDPVVGVFGEEGAGCSTVQAGRTPAALEEMPNPSLAPGQVFEFDNEKYRDAVVMPWYRNQDQPQYFYVAEICWHLSPRSAFPSSQHETFEDYYRSKYGVRITQSRQPLLDVDHTSARLNLLTPRFVNRKGVALPTSSERTKKAKRESLEQKQILVPELCHTHPFRGALWRAAVALPCILYRINSLLLADEIRRSVALVVALGRPRPNKDFRWPALDFGWSLVDVLKEEVDGKKDGTEAKALEASPKVNPDSEIIIIENVDEENCHGCPKPAEKTLNDIMKEKEESESGETGDVFEVGMWSNEMAASIRLSEENDDDMLSSAKLPGNITMCPSSQGGADWSLATSPRRQPHQRKYSVADSDASYVSSDFDASAEDVISSDEETDDDEKIVASEPSEQGGIRIEFKSGNEAEAIELVPELQSSPVADPLAVQRHAAQELASRQAFTAFFYGREAREDETTLKYIEKFTKAVEANELDILKSGVLVPVTQSVESIKMQEFSETISFHNNQTNIQMFGARGVIKHWNTTLSITNDSSTEPNLKTEDNTTELVETDDLNLKLEDKTTELVETADLNLKMEDKTTEIVETDDLNLELEDKTTEHVETDDLNLKIKDKITKPVKVDDLSLKVEDNVTTDNLKIQAKTISSEFKMGNSNESKIIAENTRSFLETSKIVQANENISSLNENESKIDVFVNENAGTDVLVSRNDEIVINTHQFEVLNDSKDLDMGFGDDKTNPFPDVYDLALSQDEIADLFKEMFPYEEIKQNENGLLKNGRISLTDLEMNKRRILREIKQSLPKESWRKYNFFALRDFQDDGEFDRDYSDVMEKHSESIDNSAEILTTLNNAVEIKSTVIGVKDNAAERISTLNNAVEIKSTVIGVKDNAAERISTLDNEAEITSAVNNAVEIKSTSSVVNTDNVIERLSTVDNAAEIKSTVADVQIETAVNNVDSVDGKISDFDANFSFDYQPDLSSHPGPSPSVILQALTMSNANDGINLERLETIGDSFLKYAITTYLYCTYQNIHEGKLSHLRSKQVSNLNLYRLGRIRALGGRMVASKFEPHDNWLPPCHRVPPHLERALIDTHIPSTLWNVADMPSLENMTREQIEKLVKENVALQHSKPSVHQDLRSNSKHEDSIEDFKKRLNTSCPVHGIQDKTSFYDIKPVSTPKTGEKSDSDKDKISVNDLVAGSTAKIDEKSDSSRGKTSSNDARVDSTPNVDKKSDPSKEISVEIGGIEKGSDGKLVADSKISVGDANEDKIDGIKDKSDLTKDKSDVIKDKSDVTKDIENKLKDTKGAVDGNRSPSNSLVSDKKHELKNKTADESNITVENKMATDRKTVIENKMVAECSDSDTDDELSADKVGAIMSSIAGSGGYMGRPCTCTANNPVATARNTAALKMGEGDVYEAVPGFVPYNLITQHSIPDKSVADCVEALIGAYLIECGPRGALLFMAWLGIRVLPKEELVLPPDHPFLRIMEQATVGKSKKDAAEDQTAETIHETEKVKEAADTTKDMLKVVATTIASSKVADAAKNMPNKAVDKTKDASKVAETPKVASNKVTLGTTSSITTTSQNEDTRVEAMKKDTTGKVTEATDQKKGICVKSKDTAAMLSESIDSSGKAIYANLEEAKQLSGEKKAKKKRKKKNAKTLDLSILSEDLTGLNAGTSENVGEKISDRLKTMNSSEKDKVRIATTFELDCDALKTRRKRKNRKKRKGNAKNDEAVEKSSAEGAETVRIEKNAVTLKESEETVKERQIPVGLCSKTVKECDETVKESLNTVRSCNKTLEGSEKAEQTPEESMESEKDKCIFKMCVKKSNVLPKFVDEMDIWCGDEVTDEDSCSDEEEPVEGAEVGKAPEEKDPYDSEDDESELEDDWNWDDRVPGSLKPQKDKDGRWIQVVFGELEPPPSPLLRNVPHPEGELMQMLSGYDSLERTLKYRFRDRCYLLQAMTHASHSSNRLTDCYQRLEFLGDAVLDYLITRQLYEDPRRHSPGALTDLRSALVNNTIFASLAVRHGMHKYFRHLSPGLEEVLMRFVKIQEENGHSISEELYLLQEDECEQAEDVEVPKALGDLFESVAGAIFLDSGMSLDAVWKVYRALMQREMDLFSESVPKSPVRELLEMEPETAKFGKPEKLADGRRVRVTVEVLGAGAFKGVGRNYRIAKCTAAKCALRHLSSPKGRAGRK